MVSDELDLWLRNKNVFDCQGKIEYNRKVQGGLLRTFRNPLGRKAETMMRLNVAIDGPVGAGKSTVADAVAQRLGILHLDTGAMYRALGLTALRRGIDVQDEQAIVDLCLGLDVSVSHEADGQHTYVEGEDVTGLIRTPEVSMAASTVSSRSWPQKRICCWMGGISARRCCRTRRRRST